MNQGPPSPGASEGPFSPTPSGVAVTDSNDPFALSIVASTQSFSHLRHSSAIASSVSTGTCTLSGLLDATSNQWDGHASSHQLTADERSVASPSVYSVELSQQVKAAEARLNTCTSADFASRTNLLDSLSVASHMNAVEDFSSRTNLAADIASAAASRINLVEDSSAASHSFGASAAVRLRSTCSSAFDFATLTPATSLENTLSATTTTGFRNAAEFSRRSLGSCSELQIPSSAVVASRLNLALHESHLEELEAEDSKPTPPQSAHMAALGTALANLTLTQEMPSESLAPHSETQPAIASSQDPRPTVAEATDAAGEAPRSDSGPNPCSDKQTADSMNGNENENHKQTGGSNKVQEHEPLTFSLAQSTTSLFEKNESHSSANHSIADFGTNRRDSLAPTLGGSASPDSSSNHPSARQSPRPPRRPPTRECRSVSICDVGDGIMQVTIKPLSLSTRI